MLSDILPPKGKLAKTLECKNRIGSGDLFDVYAAAEEGSEQRFVVKVLRREFQCDQKTLKKFEQEQMIASAVQHKNINKVLGFGALPEEYSLRPYIASEFIDGVSLTEAFRSWGQCESGVAASITSQVCAALSAAHELGAVHGDSNRAISIRVLRIEEQSRLLILAYRSVFSARSGQAVPTRKAADYLCSQPCIWLRKWLKVLR